MTRPPIRGLTPVGQAFWDRFLNAHGLPGNEATVELLQVTCEQLDERTQLRRSLFERREWRDRVALRALDAQVAINLTTLIDRTANGNADGATSFDQLLASLVDPA
jgi:hypothetical protein